MCYESLFTGPAALPSATDCDSGGTRRIGLIRLKVQRTP
jgi:hypothetical protein